MPPCYIMVTVGLTRRAESSRITVATDPWPRPLDPSHLVVSPEEIDDALMAWVKEAAAFATAK